MGKFCLGEVANFVTLFATVAIQKYCSRIVFFSLLTGLRLFVGSLLLMLSMVGIMLCARARCCAGKQRGGFRRVNLDDEAIDYDDNDDDEDDDDDEYNNEYLRPRTLGRHEVHRLQKLNGAGRRQNVEYVLLTNDDDSKNDDTQINDRHSQFSQVALSD